MEFDRRRRTLQSVHNFSHLHSARSLIHSSHSHSYGHLPARRDAVGDLANYNPSSSVGHIHQQRLCRCGGKRIFGPVGWHQRRGALYVVRGFRQQFACRPHPLPIRSCLRHAFGGGSREHQRHLSIEGFRHIRSPYCNQDNHARHHPCAGHQLHWNHACNRKLQPDLLRQRGSYWGPGSAYVLRDQRRTAYGAHSQCSHRSRCWNHHSRRYL